MPVSERRSAAARANGAKSRGPVTPEGKARSAANSRSHGLSVVAVPPPPPPPTTTAGAGPGATICLTNENQTDFDSLHQCLILEQAPVTPSEHLTVHELAVTRWRLQRSWLMEAALLDNQMDRQAAQPAQEPWLPTDETMRAALAFRSITEQSPSLSVLLRYESRLTRQVDRCLKRLEGLRASREKSFLPIEPNEPNETPIGDDDVDDDNNAHVDQDAAAAVHLPPSPPPGSLTGGEALAQPAEPGLPTPASQEQQQQQPGEVEHSPVVVDPANAVQPPASTPRMVELREPAGLQAPQPASSSDAPHPRVA